MGSTSIRFKKTITKYVLTELVGPGFLGLLIFTFVLLMNEVLRLIELVINKGVSLKTVLEMIMYIMPSFLVLTIPMAVLVAILTAFGRLSTDSEITAMKASGISLYSLLVPVLLFALLANGVTFFLYAKALPWGNHNFRVKWYELVRTKAAIGSKEGVREQIFNRAFPGLVIYIDEILDTDNSLKGVMIADSREQQNPQIIFARKGRLITDEKALRVILHLEEGISHPNQVAKSLKYQMVEFPALDILLNFQKENEPQGGNLPRDERAMTISELWGEYQESRQQGEASETHNNENNPEKNDSLSQKPGFKEHWLTAKQIFWDSLFMLNPSSNHYLVELHKRFSIPFACIVFGLIGLPLGIQSRRAGKSGGYAISLVLILIYYIFIHAGEALGDDGRLPVILAVWTPNVLLGITGILLLIRMARR